MSSFGIWLAETLNRMVPPQKMHRDLDQSKLSVADYQVYEYDEAQRMCSEFGPRWNVSGQRVLDVGSGLGGKPVYYAEAGARQVVGIDIRPLSVQAAVALGRQRGLTQTTFLIGNAARTPFPDNCFEVIVSFNVLEHVADLYRTLAECQRVLHPQGLMFLHFPPFYSPWGAHLEGWINFPWPHVFFSDGTLIEVARRAEAKRRHNENFIPSAQVNWVNLERLPELNRATVGQVYSIFKQLGVEIIEEQMLPFGRHYLAKRGPLAQAGLAILKRLAVLPVLREVITTKMTFVLGKGKRN